MYTYEDGVADTSAVLGPAGGLSKETAQAALSIAFVRQELRLKKAARSASLRRKSAEQRRVPRPPQSRINAHGPPYHIIELSNGPWYAAYAYGYSYTTIRLVWDVVVEIMHRAEDAILA